jgi:hypothetical protein
MTGQGRVTARLPLTSLILGGTKRFAGLSIWVLSNRLDDGSINFIANEEEKE